MKKRVAAILFVVLAALLVLAGCQPSGNQAQNTTDSGSVYINGVDYTAFPKNILPVYGDGIVYDYSEDDNATTITYGSKDDYSKLSEFYMNLFEKDEYSLISQMTDASEYMARGVTQDFMFEMDIKISDGQLRDYYENTVQISAYPLTDELRSDIDFYDIGMNYSEGLDGREINYDKALHNLKIAAIDYDNVDAQVALGNLHKCGPEELNDYPLALEYFYMAAEHNDPYAIYKIGYFHYKGKPGIPQDYDIAFSYLTQAVELGYADAEWKLGLCYLNGYGVEQDYEMAMEWIEKAAQRNLPAAISELGEIYYFGLTGEQDYAKALSYFTEASELGHVRATYLIGIMYINGQGVEQDYDMALSYLSEAADNDYNMAMVRLGNLYARGIKEHLEPDIDEALALYTRSADSGYINAMLQLGSLYRYGLYTARDYDKAYDYYNMAYEEGHTDARALIGDLYFHGYGVEQDKQKARQLYTEVSDLGSVYGKARLAISYMDDGTDEADEMAFNLAKEASDAGEKEGHYAMGLAYYYGINVEADGQMSVDYWTKASEQNHIRANYMLGKIYYEGFSGQTNVLKDVEQAIKWFRRGANKGDEESMYLLGTIYIDSNYEKGHMWLQKAAEAGYAPALQMLDDLG